MREFSALGLLLRVRYLLLTAMAVFMYVGSALHLPADNDWQFFTWGSDVLFGEHYPFVRSMDHIEADEPGGLHLYANYPFLQIGPPAILLAKLLQIGPREGLFVAGALVQLLGLVAILCLDRAFRPDGCRRRHDLSVLIGGAFALVLWVGLTHTTHLDDAITLSALGGAALALRRDRYVWGGALLGLSAASKPWGIVLLGLVMMPRRWRQRLTVGAAAAAVGIAFWGPFVVADPQTLSVGGVQLIVRPGSVLSVFTPTQVVPHPTFLRLAQFGIGLLLVALIAWRTRLWALGPLAAFTTRLLLDPGPYQYYATAIVLAAFMADVAVVKARVPVLTSIVTISWIGAEVATTDLAAAWIRLVAYGLLLAVALLLALSSHRRSSRRSEQGVVTAAEDAARSG